MEMQGERTIRASRAEVWLALNSTEVLKASIPGCEEFEKTGETRYEAKVRQKIGPVKARFTCIVELADIVEGESYTISGEGKGGAAGFAKGAARVRLEDHEEGCRLVYEAEARVGGKLAQLGSRLIDGFAKKMADEFFTRFQEAVEPPAPEEEIETERAEGTEEEDSPEKKKKGWFRRLVGAK